MRKIVHFSEKETEHRFLGDNIGQSGQTFMVWNPLGPVHTGRGAPRNKHLQIMEHIVVNGSVHTACKQHQRVCLQICVEFLRVLGIQAGVSVWLHTLVG